MQFTSIITHPVTSLVVSGELTADTVLVSEIVVGTRAANIIKSMKCLINSAEPVKNMMQSFADYLEGKCAAVPSVSIDYGNVSAFKYSVLTAACRVPYGTTCSYARLALMAGFPGAFRAAASVMRNNRVPLLIPCHRIIKSDGTCGAYCGDDSGMDADLKKALLQLEEKTLKKYPVLLSPGT